MDFSKWFKDKRKGARLSQVEAGEIFGVSGRTISSWETGENEPQPPKRREIEAYFSKKVETEEVVEVDRSIIIEALVRNLLKQIAKDRGERQRRDWKDVLTEIDADTLEEMNKIAVKLRNLNS